MVSIQEKVTDSELKQHGAVHMGIDQEFSGELHDGTPLPREFSWDWDGSDGFDDFSTSESLDWVAFQGSDLESFQFDFVITDESWGGEEPATDDLVREEADPGAQMLLKKHNDEERKNLLDIGAEKNQKTLTLKVVSEDDYDDEWERQLVRALRQRVINILKKTDKARKYLEWFHTGETDVHNMCFDRISWELGANPDAVRLKLHSYLYRHWITLSEPISFLAKPPPEGLINRGMYYGGQAGESVIRETWAWPGITLQVLAKRVIDLGYSPAVTKATIEALLESRIILDQMENCYCVGHYGMMIDRTNPWN